MAINTADNLFERSTIKLLETYISDGNRVYKVLLSIDRYGSKKFSPLAMDNIIMTLHRNDRKNVTYFNVLETTSSRCRSVFYRYKEGLGEYEFANYIKSLYRYSKDIASAVGVAGHSAHIIRYEAWHDPVLAKS